MTHEEETRNFLGYEDDDYDDGSEGSGCYNCGGRRWVVFCIDDMCRGAGECMHGDGEGPCPVCNKDGSREDQYL